MAILFLNGLIVDGVGGIVERGGVLVEGDLIVVEGNPIEDIGVVRRAVKLVMKGGCVYRDELA